MASFILYAYLSLCYLIKPSILLTYHLLRLTVVHSLIFAILLAFIRDLVLYSFVDLFS